MSFCKIIRADDIEIVVMKEWDKNQFIVSVYFVINEVMYGLSTPMDSRQQMEEEFEETTESVCMEIYNDTKALLN